MRREKSATREVFEARSAKVGARVSARPRGWYNTIRYKYGTGDEATCRESQAELAEHYGVSVRSIRSWERELEQAGIVRIESRQGHWRRLHFWNASGDLVDQMPPAEPAAPPAGAAGVGSYPRQELPHPPAGAAAPPAGAADIENERGREVDNSNARERAGRASGPLLLWETQLSDLGLAGAALAEVKAWIRARSEPAEQIVTALLEKVRDKDNPAGSLVSACSANYAAQWVEQVEAASQDRTALELHIARQAEAKARRLQEAAEYDRRVAAGEIAETGWAWKPPAGAVVRP